MHRTHCTQRYSFSFPTLSYQPAQELEVISCDDNIFSSQLVFNTLLPLSVLPIILLFLIAAVVALQSATAVIMIFEVFCIEMLGTELATAIVAGVRAYILRMVTSFAASCAH